MNVDLCNGWISGAERHCCAQAEQWVRSRMPNELWLHCRCARHAIRIEGPHLESMTRDEAMIQAIQEG
jgi:hypothetical protein